MCDERCFYCDNFLAPGHEHDHFPVPERHGGTETVCACTNCHTLKDRVPLKNWTTSAAVELMALWPKLSTTQRIFMAKFHAFALDMTLKP